MAEPKTPRARRATDHLPFSQMVTRANLDDRLATVAEQMDGHVELADERWSAHKEAHGVVEQSLRDYKRDANEWRASLADLRLTFIPKAEFQSEHRALDAKLHGEIQGLSAVVASLDARLDVVTAETREATTERIGRRSVFSDSRNVVASISLVFGIIASLLLLIDRLTRT